MAPDTVTLFNFIGKYERNDGEYHGPALGGPPGGQVEKTGNSEVETVAFTESRKG